MTSQLTEIALQMLGTIERMELIIPEITDTIRKALEERAALVEPQPPADGEVAELVACLHRLARADWLSDETADILTRAADLLERLAPQPKPELVWPTDEDLVELACAEVYNSRNWEEPECTTDDPYPYEASSFAWLNFARAVLARWGRP
jgi:hypothetical protein